MHFDIITIFPEMLSALNYGIPTRAQKSGLIQIKTWDLREFSDNSYRRVDERPFGGGPGMVMMYEPLKKAITAAKAASIVKPKVVHLTPQGIPLKQKYLQEVVADASMQHLIFLAGRYEGIDERLIEDEVDLEWSLGDYVLSGGELAAMVIIDALTRLLPGALGEDASAEQDSFMNGLLDYPHYTRPPEVSGKAVPEVLLSGDHAKIARWRLKQSLGRTWLRRPDLLEQKELTKGEKLLLDEFIKENVQK
ncbi:MAG: tRNA (guanosine(37)-N1)-methyltransferase TrmD [Gammaproteobacteria bacterium]